MIVVSQKPHELRGSSLNSMYYVYIYIYWTAIDNLSMIWKSDLTDKMKRSFFQAALVSILLYGCTTWTLTKRLEKKLDGNNTRMLRAKFKSPGGNTPQSTNYTATYLPSWKLFKLDEPDTQETPGEAGTSSSEMYSDGPQIWLTSSVRCGEW